MEIQYFIKREDKRSGARFFKNLKFIDGFANIKSGIDSDLLKHIESRTTIEDCVIKYTQIMPIYIKCQYSNMGNAFFERDGISYVRLDRIEEVRIIPGQRLHFKCKDVGNKYFAILDDQDERDLDDYLENHLVS